MSGRILLNLLYLGCLLAVGLFLYLPACRNDFVYDDIANIVDNPSLRDPGVADYVFSPQFGRTLSGPDYYSPISTLSYAMDARRGVSRQTGQLSASGFHATNLALYLAVCLLAYACFALMTRRPGLSALAAFFFLVHPMHSENVNYVSSRPETLGAFFALIMILASWIETKALWARVAQFFAVAFAALFAMLSSAAGLAAPLVMLAADWARIRAAGGGKGAWAERLRRAYAPAALALAVCVALRLAVFGSLFSVQTVHPFFETLSAGGRVLAWFQTLLRYVSRTVLPYPSTAIYNPLEEGSKAFAAGGPVSAGIVLGLGALLALAGRKAPWLWAGSLWFFAALLPNLPFRPTFLVVSESKLLLPGAGACLAAAGVFFALGDSRQPLLEGARNTAVSVVAALALTTMAALSYSRGLDWKSGPDLWRAERVLHPEEETVLSSVAYYQAREGYLEEAEKTLLKALENYSTRPAVFYELAVNDLRMGKKDEALQVLDRGLAESGVTQSSFFVRLGTLYDQLGELEKAQQAFELGVRKDPGNWASRFLLGNALLTRRRTQEAIDEYTRALKSAPPTDSRAAVLTNRSIARRQIGDLDGAIQDAEDGIRFDPFEPRLRIELSNAWLSKSSEVALGEKNDEPSQEEARRCLSNAVRVLQDGVSQVAPDRDLYLALSDLQRSLSYPDEALHWATRCREAFPTDPKARLYEAMLLVSMNRFDAAGVLFASMMDDPVLRDHPTALAGLGFCLFQKGAYPEAKDRCELALRRDKANPMGLLLYRFLAEKGVPMDPDLIRGLPPNIIMPRGPVAPEYQAPQAPLELPLRGPMP